MELSPTATLREVAVGVPGATRVFDNLRLDYCCGGKRSLAEAASEANLPVDTLLGELRNQAAASEARGRGPDFSTKSLSELIEHILAVHHTFTRAEIERLAPLGDKVLRRHGEAHPELQEVVRLLEGLADDLGPHLVKEEQVLFPFIKELEAGLALGTAPRGCFGSVRNPISAMQSEHEAAGDILKKLRQLTSDYTPPEGACMSYRAFYNGLAELDRDLIQHIHLENNVLFPRAVEAEQG